MKKPVLVIMAAGMGSRYGGLKQIDPIDKEGHLIIDFSIYDAVKAGFRKVIFIIKKEIENDIKEMIDKNIAKQVEVEYVFQDLNTLPDGYTVPEGRVKPWGTGHAVMCCIDKIDAPFAVINADDYYGPKAFEMLYTYLKNAADDDIYRYTMAGYILENTLTDYGYVARGVCETGEDGLLTGVVERVHIEKFPDGAAYTEDNGATWVKLRQGTTVSMNMWGFTESILKELKIRFAEFLNINLTKNPLSAEYFLPNVVGDLIQEGKAQVRVLNTDDRWYGVTYKEDKQFVVDALAELKDKGVYPEHLWF